MELFSDSKILEDFSREYNFKSDYILEGQCINNGFIIRSATFFVKQSMASTCYLHCYIVYMQPSKEKCDSIGLQSSCFDSVFRYRYNYIDMTRSGINLSIKPIEIFKTTFSMDNSQYDFSYFIGYNNSIGGLEDYDKKGEIVIPLHTDEIEECYNISLILYRLAMFMTSHKKVSFKKITLYKKKFRIGWLYSPLISDNNLLYEYGAEYSEMSVEKYIPKILNNIALDVGNKITQSIPLGHLGDLESLFSPQRFIEQIMSFEYLFEKLEPQKAKDKNFPLKEELKYAFDLFPELLSDKETSENICSDIKELRRTISHGYAYYYDFKDDWKIKHIIIVLDELIKKLSLKWIGFSDSEIKDYKIL